MFEKGHSYRGVLAVETSIALKRLSEAKVGEIISYDELNKLCGCNVRERRNVLTTSINKLLTDHNMVFVTEWGQGLRLVPYEEVPDLSQRDIRKLSKAARRSQRRLTAVDYDQLSEPARLKHNTTLTILQFIQKGATQHAQNQIEAAVKVRTRPLPMDETLKLFGAPREEGSSN